MLTELNLTHLQLIKSLMNEAFPQLHSYKWINKLSSELRCFGLFFDHKLIAFVATKEYGEFLFLYSLCVAKAFRRRGFGKELLIEMLTVFKNLSGLVVHLNYTDIDMRENVLWYKRMGYQIYHISSKSVYMVKYG